MGYRILASNIPSKKLLRNGYEKIKTPIANKISRLRNAIFDVELFFGGILKLY